MAARAQFASVGFDRTTIRSIARQAEVDPALVVHHFGTEEQLFVRVLDLPMRWAGNCPGCWQEA